MNDFRLDLFFVAFCGIAAGLALLVLYVLVSYARVLLTNLLARRRAVPAILVRKSTRMYGYDSPLSGRGILQSLLKRSVRPRGTACLRHVCWLTFRVSGGRIEFAVPEEVYQKLQEGSVGVLSFKGERFVGFRPSGAGEA